MEFLKETLINPKRTGAIAPSSRQLTSLILEAAELEANQTVVELGPGTGVFTGEILERLSPGGQYIGIEINPVFARELKERYSEAVIYHGSAADIKSYLQELGEPACDRIISGLPWSVFRADAQESLLATLHEHLAADGVFVTFSYPPFHHLPRGRSFRTLLGQTFRTVEKTETVFNLPPAFVYICRK